MQLFFIKYACTYALIKRKYALMWIYFYIKIKTE